MSNIFSDSPCAFHEKRLATLEDRLLTLSVTMEGVSQKVSMGFDSVDEKLDEITTKLDKTSKISTSAYQMSQEVQLKQKRNLKFLMATVTAAIAAIVGKILTF